MKYLLTVLAISSLTLGCVVKKDSAASAAVSAELAKQLAKSFAGGATGTSASISGTTAAAVPTCATSGSTITCSSPGIEMQITISGSNITGYQKMTNYQTTAGGKTYSISGTITISGTSTATATYNNGQYSFTANTNETFNGKLTISGADNFEVEYRAFSVNVGISGSGTSFSTSFTCGGKLVVDTIEFAVQSDCSI